MGKKKRSGRDIRPGTRGRVARNEAGEYSDGAGESGESAAPDRGVGNRLKAPPSVELIESANAFELCEGAVLFGGMSYADIAHVIMLIEEGILPQDSGKKLLGVLLALHDRPVGELGFHPKYGDLYTNRVRLLKEQVGRDAGWLHSGRARRECSTVGWLIETRERLLSFGRSITNLSHALIGKSERHIHDYMPDYTYLQHAQPTTLAHYFLTFVYSLLRDLERLCQTYHRLNVSPAGSGSVNGSRLPLNRERVARLLGFQGLTVHTRDAMWRADVAYELSAVIVAACINIDRLAEELQIWSSAEFGMVELADEYCRTSVIMPQKKNPYGLAYFRGLTGLMIGRSAGVASIQKTTSGQPDSRIFAYGEIPESLSLCGSAVQLVASAVGTMEVKSKVMEARVRSGFSGATDLAEIIMLRSGLDFGTAYQIVGAAVRSCIASEREEFTLDALRTAAAGEGAAIEISEEDIRDAVDPMALVEARRGTGSAGTSSVKKMLRECRRKTTESTNWIVREHKRLAGRLEVLLETARAIIS
jgi:argininosuccinate lyase